MQSARLLLLLQLLEDPVWDAIVPLGRIDRVLVAVCRRGDAFPARSARQAELFKLDAHALVAWLSLVGERRSFACLAFLFVQQRQQVYIRVRALSLMVDAVEASFALP